MAASLRVPGQPTAGPKEAPKSAKKWIRAGLSILPIYPSSQLRAARSLSLSPSQTRSLSRSQLSPSRAG